MPSNKLFDLCNKIKLNSFTLKEMSISLVFGVEVMISAPFHKNVERYKVYWKGLLEPAVIVPV